MRSSRHLLPLAALALLGVVGAAMPQETSAPNLPGPSVSPATPKEVWTEGVPSTAVPALYDRGPLAWGLVGFRGFVNGSQAAPNGVDFQPLFSIDSNFNLWLWKDQRLYGFSEARFWGQKAAPGITNGSQGAFDFSKREFDLDLGAAWNYFGTLEARLFAYSRNNLNRGTSLAAPHGFIDGVGLENRWYVGGSYPDLGRPGFDVAYATFVSAGFYPTKDMVDVDGNTFKPGPFLRAYFTYALFDTSRYLFLDVQGIATQSFTPKLVNFDAGAAWRPFERVPYLEFRVGSEGRMDIRQHEQSILFYGAVRIIF